EQIRTLGEGSSHEQTTITSSLDGEVVLVSIFLCDQVFGCGDEIVKDVLLLVQHSGTVPFFTELVTTAQLHVRINASALQQDKHGIAIKEWSAAEIEASVTRKQRGS